VLPDLTAAKSFIATAKFITPSAFLSFFFAFGESFGKDQGFTA
jgi:hypothetical protein